MNKSKLLVARVTIGDAADEPTWITDDESSHYTAVDFIDLDDATVQRTFELYEKSYEYLGKPFLEEPDQLAEYSRWILLYRGDSRDAADLVACALFKVTPCGLKGGLKASDGTAAGKQATTSFAIASYNLNEVFGEISGRLERAILAHVPVVPFSVAQRVMRRLSKEIRSAGDGTHFVRTLHGEEITKVMVGRPLASDDEPVIERNEE